METDPSTDGTAWTYRSRPNATTFAKRGQILVSGNTYSTDGITWLTIPGGITSSLACQINGVWCVLNTTTNGCTVHNGRNVFRIFESVGVLIAANTAATVMAASAATSVITIPATGGPTAYFRG